jgi:hypothetical protein
MKKPLKYPKRLAEKDARDNKAYTEALEYVGYKIEERQKFQEEAIDKIIQALEDEKEKVHLRAGYQAIELRISELLEQARNIKINIILAQK